MPVKRPQITVEHFETIEKASIQFDTYLKEVHRGDEAKNAKTKGVRADNLRFDAVRRVQLPPGTTAKRTVVMEIEGISSDTESELSSIDSSEPERKKRKKRSRAKRKGKEAVHDDHEAGTVGSISKHKARKGRKEGDGVVSEGSRKIEAKQEPGGADNPSDSESSDE